MILCENINSILTWSVVGQSKNNDSDSGTKNNDFDFRLRYFLIVIEPSCLVKGKLQSATALKVLDINCAPLYVRIAGRSSDFLCLARHLFTRKPHSI